VFFYHYTREDQSKSEEAQRARLKAAQQPQVQGWKKHGFKKKPAQWFFWVIWGFFGFFVFFLFLFLYICPEERVFRVFFSFKNTFRCIQTLNYNHSY
jgi:hypothetical protein